MFNVAKHPLTCHVERPDGRPSGRSEASDLEILRPALSGTQNDTESVLSRGRNARESNHQL
jgi:hypothetical protein